MKTKRISYILKQFTFFVAIFFGIMTGGETIVSCGEIIVSCEPINVQSETPIFDNTEKIDLYNPYYDINYGYNERFIWDGPDDVDNLVMALFNSPPAVSDGLITNTQDWVAGASSDMPQFHSGYIHIQELVLFDDTIGDYGSFTGTQFTDIPAHFGDGDTMYWAVWAFSYGILTHSSPAYKIIVYY